jgi:hypothetical protein
VGRYLKDSFELAVHRRFGPLAMAWGMAAPEDDRLVIPSVTYRLGGLAYRWLHDPHEYGVTVHIVLERDGTGHAIGLRELVVAAGLGAPQHVRTDARTWRAMRQAIESHVGWLDRLHPHLSSTEAIAFLDNLGARQRHLT